MLNKKILRINIKPRLKKYPYFHSSSGMYLKFIPYIPVIRVKGRKIVVMEVNTFITSFKFLDDKER